MPRSNLQTILAAIRANNNCVFNNHTNTLREVHAVGLVSGFVVALYNKDYFTLSAIELNAEGIPCLKVGSVVGGVISINDETTMEQAIESYNNLDNYDLWYRQHHKQITHITYVV